jgi:hypothetical protein
MRAVWVCVLVTTASPALADDDAPQVALAAEVGAVGGGGATPGGMRVGGRFLYRLAEHDWFDGGMAFTFGRGTAGCGAVEPDAMSCQHGVADGFAGDLSFGVRRDLGGQAGFVPFARVALFGRVLRFAYDDVTGAAAGGGGGVGIRAAVRPGLAVVGGATAFAGMAHLSDDIGAAGQLGLSIAAAAEFRMR